MKYTEWKENRQAEFNKLPIFYAFSREQFETAMQERGLTAEDTDKIYKLGSTGGFYLKKDAEIVKNYFNTPSELPELMKDYEFAKDAIYYEMCNHEYGINWEGNWNVCECFAQKRLPYFGDEMDGTDECNAYFDIMGWSEETRRAWRDAERAYNKDAIENDWI